MTVLHIHAFKWGDMYGVQDVNRLRAMLARHLTVPHVFHCSTEASEGLRPDILVHPLPAVDFCDWDPGFARKVAIFSAGFLGLDGELLLQIDLDMVVTGNIDFLVNRPEEDFLIARGRNQANNSRGHSAIMRHRLGTMTDVWERLIADPGHAVAVAQSHRNPPGYICDQRWVDYAIPDMRFFEDGRIVYFRQDCNAVADHDNPIGVVAPPAGARIVSFAGRIKPQHVMDGSCGNWRHAPFVREHWRE